MTGTITSRRVSMTVQQISDVLDCITAALQLDPENQSLKDLQIQFTKQQDEIKDPRYCALALAFRAAVPVSDGDLEIDEDAEVSFGDDPGAYVMVWKWVPEEDLKDPL